MQRANEQLRCQQEIGCPRPEYRPRQVARRQLEHRRDFRAAPRSTSSPRARARCSAAKKRKLRSREAVMRYAAFRVQDLVTSELTVVAVCTRACVPAFTRFKKVNRLNQYG